MVLNGPNVTFLQVSPLKIILFGVKMLRVELILSPIITLLASETMLTFVHLLTLRLPLIGPVIMVQSEHFVIVNDFKLDRR